MSRIRVLVADDHAVLRSGLKLLINLQSDMHVVGEASSHSMCLSEVSASTPDVLTLDMSMPDGNALNTVRLVKQTSPNTKIVILTMHDDVAFKRQMLSAGASAYLPKTSADTELLDAIRCVSRGEEYVPTCDAKTTRATSPSEDVNPPTPISLLSAREYEVLRLIAQGHTNQAIADQLFLSVKTIESYRSRLMNKLGLHSRAELTRLALEVGLLSRE